jgi:hypothetical protein
MTPIRLCRILRRSFCLSSSISGNSAMFFSGTMKFETRDKHPSLTLWALARQWQQRLGTNQV